MNGDGPMANISQHTLSFESLGAAAPNLFRRFEAKIRQIQIEPHEVFWWCFVGAVTAATTLRHLGDITGPLYYLLTIGGTAACGWAWLFARTIFRPAGAWQGWPIMAVGAIVAFESLWGFTSGLSVEGVSGDVRRVAANAASMVCISALALVFVEAISGYNTQSPESERRFRQAFVAVFGAFIAVVMIVVGNAEEGSFFAQWKEATIMSSVVVILAASRMAIRFRRRNPLTATRRQASSKFAPRAAGDKALAVRIEDAIKRDQSFTVPNLKVADFASSLNEHDYKVTQCITGLLGYRNFNHFINSHRIDHAKRMLADASEDRPILSIAYDCGFNSIGTFNRAFKEIVGMSPRDYRAAQSAPPALAQAG